MFDNIKVNFHITKQTLHSFITDFFHTVHFDQIFLFSIFSSFFPPGQLFNSKLSFSLFINNKANKQTKPVQSKENQQTEK